MTLSVAQRPALIQRLRTEVFDLLVVGGGITGAGIARDAALRGLQVALIERGDFAVGTSSRSTKLIHGGLRYLEMGDVPLVFEAVRERQRLLQLAPHLARPQSFILPVQGHVKHSVFKLDVGLTVYDMLAAGSGVMPHRAVRHKALLRMEPLLKSKDLAGGVRYFDAMTDDARLVMANVRGAFEAGAVTLSQLDFLQPRLGKDGKVMGAEVCDQRTGEHLPVAARLVVAAAGPWTDEVLRRWKGGSPIPPLMPSKGVHVVVPRARLPLTHAVMMTSPLDGRVVFALPWPHATVIGTTDTAYQGPLDEPACTHEDAAYLIATTNGCLQSQGDPLQLTDIISTWAGIRPLVAQAGHSVYKTSREHVIASDPRGLVAIAGGKLTTYRVMAEQTVDAALKLLPPARVAECKPCATANLPLPGATAFSSKVRPLEQLQIDLVRGEGQSEARARHLALNYGSDARAVLESCRQEPEGDQPVLADLPWTWGELAWLTANEVPMNLLDLAVRRTQLYYVAGERLLTVADKLAERMGQWCGYPASRGPEMVEQLRNYVAIRRVTPPEAAS